MNKKKNNKKIIIMMDRFTFVNFVVTSELNLQTIQSKFFKYTFRYCFYKNKMYLLGIKFIIVTFLKLNDLNEKFELKKHYGY